MGIETLQFPPLSADLDIYTEYTYDTGETEYPQDSRLFGRHRFTQDGLNNSMLKESYTGISYIPYKPVIDYNIVDQYMSTIETTLFPENIYTSEFGFNQPGMYESMVDRFLPIFPITFKYSGFGNRELYTGSISNSIISNLTSQFHPFYSTIQSDDNRENTMTFSPNTFGEDLLSDTYNPGASTDSMTGYYYMDYNEDNLEGIGYYMGISQWYGAGLDRTWAQKNIFSNRFYTNAYGKLSQNFDQSVGEITNPVRFKGILYLPHTYEYAGLDDQGNPILPGQGTEGEQNTFSEKDNWSFWTLYSLLINDKQSITYGKERLELMLYARDSIGGGGLNHPTNPSFTNGYTFGEDLTVFPNQPSGVFEYGGERELIFYNIKFGDIILPNPPDESQEDDLYIQPPFRSGNALDTSLNNVYPLEPFYTETTFGTYIGIKFESDMISKPYELYGDAPPVDLHHMAEGITDYYYPNNTPPGGSALWDLKLGYGKLLRNNDMEITGFKRFMGSEYVGWGTDGTAINNNGLSVYEFNVWNFNLWSAAIDPLVTQQPLDIYNQFYLQYGSGFIREQARGGWSSNNDGNYYWNRLQSYKLLENPTEVLWDILTNELGYQGEYDNEKYKKLYDENEFVKLAFSIHETQSSKDIIEEICRHSTCVSFFDAQSGEFRLTSEFTGSVGGHNINIDDLVTYKLSRTPVENVKLGVNIKYGYDYAKQEFTKTFNRTHPESVMDKYKSFYNIEDEAIHQLDLEMPYIQDEESARFLAEYHFVRNKNQRCLVDFTLPISLGVSIEVGDTITFEKGMDKNKFEFYGVEFIRETDTLLSYSVLDQTLLKSFLVTSVTKKNNKVVVNGLQKIQSVSSEFFYNPYNESDQPWEFPAVEIPDYGIGAFNSLDIPTQEQYEDQEPFIPGENEDEDTDTGDGDNNNIIIGDTTGDGNVDVLDIVQMVTYIIGNGTLSDDGFFAADSNQDNTIDVLDVVAIVNIVLQGD